MTGTDNYVHEMDWGEMLPNYRRYQYNLIREYVGARILEIGSGDRGFTHQLVKNSPDLERLLSIEPSGRLFELYQDSYSFPATVSFEKADLFDLTVDQYGRFDTITMIHVLEHIEKDDAALDHLSDLLTVSGYLLIEVPALQVLYSIHDEKIGHFRRYNKSSLKKIIDPEKFRIEKLWYQDLVGVLGSLYYFKIRKTRLKSEQGAHLISKQGAVYDRYLIPVQEKIEQFIHFPIGLSLTCVLRKR